MKKTLYRLLLVYICVFAIIGGSRAQSPVQVARLATLARVWGFLKYYHPSAAKGRPDWDRELVRMIPLAEQSPTPKAFQALLENWYRSLPAASLATVTVHWKADSLVRVFTEKDIQRFKVSGRLKNELLRLYQYHLPDASRFVTRHAEGHYFDHIIHTEDTHETPSYPDSAMRLLALFRYWNTIAYFYPHKNRIHDWNNTLTAYIPRFLQAKDAAQYRAAVRELIHELPDAHSFIQEPGSAYYFTSFRVDCINGKYCIGQCDDSIAINGDYRLGDEITAINGLSAREREKELSKTATGTNAISLRRNIANTLLKTGDSLVQVGFSRGGHVFTKTVALHTWEVYSRLHKSPPKPLWEELENGIWYVRFCRITNPDTLRHLFSAISHARAVIWEMRDYPSYPVTAELGRFVFPARTQLTEERNASDSFPGVFIKNPLYFTPDTNATVTYRGPMIVLVDEHTQSLAESVSAMLRIRPKTITMGRQTAGTTGNITWFSLPGGLSVSYTGVGVTGMQRSFRQGEGVKLDIPIKLTQRRIMQGGDYILEQGLIYARKHYKGM